jgi:hypothetical protein
LAKFTVFHPWALLLLDSLRPVDYLFSQNEGPVKPEPVLQKAGLEQPFSLAF